MKRWILWITVLAVCVGLAGCSRGVGGGGEPVYDAYGAYKDFEERSQAIYQDNLGTFYAVYQHSKTAPTVSERYALMAIAEAKLMASAVFLPLNASGGNFTVSRLVPYTVPTVQWGNDNQRVHRALVTTQPVSAAHREQMRQQWYAVKGSGAYLQWARGFLKEQGYTLKDSYTVHYSSDPQTWDVLATSKSADTDAIVHTYDGLYEYDCEGVLQPALATGYEKRENPDGTVSYTFFIRRGVKWVDSQGRPVADVKADDFVAGMQHLLDAKGGLEYLVAGHSPEDSLIVNAYAYSTGKLSDFSQVGVRAVDDATLVYTLREDTPYFMTMLGYSVFAPLSREYFLSQGGGFGADYDPSSASYTYGRNPDKIACCGPYIISNHTAENTLVFRENPAYWNADAVTVKRLTWSYNDGKDALKGYQDTMSGTVDGTSLNVSSVEKAKADGTFGKYAYVGISEAVTTMAFFNLNRTATANFNDRRSAATSKSAYESSRARAAMYNVHFRRALAFCLDRSAYNAQFKGEDLKTASLRNSFTPGDFVTLPEPVTVRIGQKQITYEAGTPYGRIMQDQLDADGVKITVWNSDTQSGDGFDGWKNTQAALEELKMAVAELEAQGIPISAEEPIYLDLPYFSGAEQNTNRAYAFALSVEAALGGAVRINPVPCADMNKMYYAGYYIGYGYEANYDLYDVSGWGPDYGDPQTYLDTFLPDYAGYLTKMIGLF